MTVTVMTWVALRWPLASRFIGVKRGSDRLTFDMIRIMLNGNLVFGVLNLRLDQNYFQALGTRKSRAATRRPTILGMRRSGRRPAHGGAPSAGALLRRGLTSGRRSRGNCTPLRPSTAFHTPPPSLSIQFHRCSLGGKDPETRDL